MNSRPDQTPLKMVKGSSSASLSAALSQREQAGVANGLYTSWEFNVYVTQRGNTKKQGRAHPHKQIKEVATQRQFPLIKTQKYFVALVVLL